MMCSSIEDFLLAFTERRSHSSVLSPVRRHAAAMATLHLPERLVGTRFRCSRSCRRPTSMTSICLLMMSGVMPRFSRSATGTSRRMKPGRSRFFARGSRRSWTNFRHGMMVAGVFTLLTSTSPAAVPVRQLEMIPPKLGAYRWMAGAGRSDDAHHLI